MYTEAQLYAFAHACRNTDLMTSQLMRRLDQATAAGVFTDCVWGNMSEAQVEAMMGRFGTFCQLAQDTV